MRVVLSHVETVSFDFQSWETDLLPFHIKWGWCSLTEAVRSINACYGYSWTPRRFLHLFAHRGNMAGRMPVRLISLNDPDILLYYADLSQDDLDDNAKRWCVPAGWIKDVLFSIRLGAMAYVIRKVENGIHELWAINKENVFLFTAP